MLRIAADHPKTLDGPMTGHEVFFILGDFEGDLWLLSRTHHVWLVKSEHNTPLARDVWARESQDYSALLGVTMFDGSGDELADFYGFLGTIDQHHDEHSATEPWSTIHVRGLLAADVDAGRIASELDRDPVRVLLESGGFAIVRQPNQP